VQGRWIATAVAAVLTAAGTAAGTVVVSRSGEALRGTTIAGQDVSGQDRRALRATVETFARELTTGTLAAGAAGRTFPVDRGVVNVDIAATVDRALDAGRGGVPMVGALTGRGRAVEPAVQVDASRLQDQAASVFTAVDRRVAEGGFTVAGTAVTAVQPVAGRVVDRRQALDALDAALRAGASDVALLVTTTAPTTTSEDVAAVVGQAQRALAGPHVLGSGDNALRLTPAQVAPLLRAVPVDGELTLGLDQPGLTAVAQAEAQALEVGSQEARFAIASTAADVDTKGDLSWTPRPAVVQVVPGRAGREVDVPAAATALTAIVVGGLRGPPPAVPFTVVQPELTTAEAEAARVRSLIGTFTSSFAAGAPRARNIRRIAQLVDGTYIPAGEVLSLNRTAGERTLARGFVADGAIVDGELKDEVGGGVSQFATTLFNAAFFAGLPILEHKPHSFYISRYPAGRESTVYFGALDVKIRNDTRNGLLVKTRSTPGSVTVELYGDNGGRLVTSTTGPRRPRPDGGFRIAVTRSISGGDGVGGRRVFTTSYDPAPADHR